MTKKQEASPRMMMMRAIEVMKSSIAEERSDGKASPLVGAVLVKPDGSVETAHRGELRNGDHAEFTLLERKNRTTRLDGSVLYATLEPCAPGARSHPKLGCAERIVNARIKKVWVGIEDPDPTVDRKGIKFLQDHGVTVEMFDRELQDEIRAANASFIAQAIERRATTEAAVRDASLSPLERPVMAADLRDLSSPALDQYRSFAKIEGSTRSDGFRRLLVHQGLLKADAGQFVPSGFGMLLFGKAPRDTSPQAGLLGSIHWPDGSEEIRDFDGPMVLVPEQAIKWLRDKLPNPIGRSSARRSLASDRFYELLREGIVNALVHRNYDILGAKCQLIVTSDAITIKSPGEPVSPITVQQLQSFNAPVLSRNPVLHYVFAKMELAEERGLGLKSMKARASEIGLPLPAYVWQDPYLVLTLFRRPESATSALQDTVLSEMSAAEQKGWIFIAGRTGTTQSQYAKALRVNPRTAQRHLAHFVDLRLLKRVGSGPATEYHKL